ncbi:MAG: GLUG motif-containing protein, partial [Planctomycetota bacterium]
IGYLEAWHSTENEPFSGVFDGNGHAVWNFTHVSTDKDAVGLFRYVFGPDAEIRDVALADPNLDSGRDGVGALVGWLRAGRVMGCQVRGGRVSGSFATGGLVGDNSGIISGSRAAVYVSGDWYVGALVGFNSGVVSDCYAVGDVLGMDLVGGLVGSNIHGAISNSYATGFVSGALINGGLLGDHHAKGKYVY